MKIFYIFVSCFLVLCSCDPFQMIYVRNYSSSDVILYVSLNNQYHFPKPVYINITDTLPGDNKALFDFNFPERLYINNLNDSMYQVKLPSGSTSLLSPICMGFPIQKIIMKSGEMLDSVIFSGNNHNIRYSKRRGLLHKTSFSTFIIDFGKE